MHSPLSSRLIAAISAAFLLSSATQLFAATDSLGTWTAKNPGLSTTENFDIFGMAYGNNTFVIVGQDVNANKAFTANSLDAKTWAVKSSGSAAEGFNSVIFSNSRFIAVCPAPTTGNARIWTSDTNGNSWVTRDSDNAGLIVPGGLHVLASNGNGKIVAAGGTPGGAGWMTVSTDNGTTWRVVRNGSNYKSFSGKLYGVGYANGNWYAFSTSAAYISSDGSTWNTLGGSFPVVDGRPGYRVASNETTIVVASDKGPKWSIDNGVTWHSGTQAKGFETVTTLGDAMSSVLYADGLFVMATRNIYGSYADIWVSETGRQWKRWKSPNKYYTYSLCYAKRAFWCGGWYEKLSKSPSWFKARNGCSGDYPYTVFDTEDGPPNRIGLPQYRVNTASLNLVLESTLFYTKALCSPINFKLVYNSAPCADNSTSIGPFGKNWRFRYESAVGRFGQEAVVMAGGGRSHTFVTPNGEDLETVTNDVTLKAPDGIFDTLVYKYNATQSLQRFELTLKSSHLTYVYGTPGTGISNTGLFYLSQIKDQFAVPRTISIVTDAPTGNITSISNAGRTFNFTYAKFDGENNRCTRISMPDGRHVSFNYDSHNNLTDIYDMMGYHGVYAYDSNGFLTSMSTAGKTNTFTYADRPGTESDPIIDRYVATLTRPGGKKVTYAILDEGETVKRTDAAGQVSLFKNKDGQTTAITDPLGKVRTIVYNGAKLPESVTDEKGGVFTYEYDSNGNMTKKKDALGKETIYTYDLNNNVTSVKNALNEEWKYEYNTFYQVTKVTSPLGNVTNIGYLNYNPHDIQDPRGNTTLYTFDNFGNITSISPPATSFGYDARGFRCTSITDANSKVKTIDWDNNDRITKVTYTTAGGVSYTNTYNAFGQTAFTDELGQTASITRDELGFITSTTDPLGNMTRTEYDADNRPIKTIDALNRSTSTTYDKDGRPLVFTDAKGYKITRAYDAAGNLISFKDKNNSETTYTYDANNRQLTMSDPLKKVTTLTRDAIGRVSSSKNARNQTITFSYDQDGRLLGRTGAATVAYTRDANGNITAQKDAWGTDDATATKFTYDALNRVTKIVYPDGLEANMAWNNSGQLTSITYPPGDLVVYYTYDNFNRIPVPSLVKNNPGTELFGDSRSTNAVTGIEVKIGGISVATCSITYNDRGQIQTITRPNNTQSAYLYDDAGRVIQMQHLATGGLADADFMVNYSYNPVSNVVSEVFSGASYYLDPTLPTKMTNTFNVAGQLTNRGGQVCVNDADGNITDVGAGSFKCTYDAENRLTKTENRTSTTPLTYKTTNHTYNADGLRVKKEVVGGDTTYYHYLPSGVLLFTSDGAGTLIDCHIYAGASLLASYNNTLKDFVHYYGDRQAHVRFITDNDGRALVKYDYLPYGQVASSKTGLNDNAISKNPFTFNGMLGVQDEGNGTFYMQQRFYDSSTGRFFQKDPLGLSVGPNLYAFAGNNPIAFSDPTGKDFGLTMAVLGGTLLVMKVADMTARWYYDRQGKEIQREVMQMRNQQKLESAERNASPDDAWVQRNMNEADRSRQDTTHVIEQTQKDVGVVRDVTAEVAQNTVQDAILGPTGSLVTDLIQEAVPASSTADLPPPQPQSTEGGN